MTSKYEIVIYWERRGQRVHREVPELPGCMIHGDTREKALAMAEDAIQGWLAVAREFGDPIPGPKGRKLMYA